MKGRGLSAPADPRAANHRPCGGAIEACRSRVPSPHSVASRAAPLCVPRASFITGPAWTQTRRYRPARIDASPIGDKCAVMITTVSFWHRRCRRLDKGFGMEEKGGSQRSRAWGPFGSVVDGQWQNAFVDYAISKSINACYWSINPESAETGGLYGTTYVAGSSESGWGTWTTIDSRKMDLLKRHLHLAVQPSRPNLPGCLPGCRHAVVRRVRLCRR